jgi:hypothetical protein
VQGLQKINDFGGVDAFVDNNTLTIIDSDKALNGKPFVVSESMGMVGIPEATQQGVNVTVMLNPQIQLGGSIVVNSIVNPAVNPENNKKTKGVFKIKKLNFEVANRDVPFWYVLETSNLGYYQGN